MTLIGTVKKTIAEYDVVFCDSRQALQLAYKNGLKKDTLVLTTGPAVLLDDDINSLDMAGDEKLVGGFMESFQIFLADTYEELINTNELKEYALTITKALLLSCNTFVIASSLKKKDYTEPRLIITCESSNSKYNERIQSPIVKLMSSNSRLGILNTNIDVPFKELRTPNFISRIRLLGWRYLVFRLSLSFWGKFNFQPKKQAFILSDNEMLFGTLYHLVLRGYSIRRVAPKLSDADVTPELGEKINTKITLLLKKYMAGFIISHSIEPCCSLVMANILSDVRLQLRTTEGSESIIEKISKSGDSILLTNYPVRPDIIGLSNLCRKYGVKIHASQHGVAREISASHMLGEVCYENGVADLLYVYNHSSKTISDKSKYRYGKSLTVGLPAPYHNLGRSKVRSNKILYISTLVYRGYVGLVQGTASDKDKALTEIGIINNVLKNASHSITYKPYPMGVPRYLDADPVLEILRISENIEIIEDNYDLRYLVHNYDILITSRATSTLSWCLMSGKPVVFIDVHNDSRLNREAKIQLSKSVFYFNTASNAFYEDMLSLINKAIGCLYDEYEVMKENRVIFINRYIDSMGPGAEKRAAQSIFNAS